MPTATEKVAAAAALGLTTLKLSTAEAIALARTLPDGAARHPERLAGALAAYDALGPSPDPVDVEALAAYGTRVAEVLGAFWDAFEMQEVDGIAISQYRPMPPAPPAPETPEEQP